MHVDTLLGAGTCTPMHVKASSLMTLCSLAFSTLFREPASP